MHTNDDLPPPNSNTKTNDVAIANQYGDLLVIPSTRQSQFGAGLWQCVQFSLVSPISDLWCEKNHPFVVLNSSEVCH